jgi:ADP-ribose pyrophosphatase
MEKFLNSTTIYDGRIIKVKKDVVELPNGAKSDREVVLHSGGVGIVAVDDEENIYLVKQYRYPVAEYLLEIPAGKRSPEEPHRECGIRELQEEIGARAENFEYMGCLLPTPAYNTEVIHLYFATALTFTEQNLDEDEFLDVVKMPFQKAVQLCIDGEITDAKSQVGIFKTALLKMKQ